MGGKDIYDGKQTLMWRLMTATFVLGLQHSCGS